LAKKKPPAFLLFACLGCPTRQFSTTFYKSGGNSVAGFFVPQTIITLNQIPTLTFNPIHGIRVLNTPPEADSTHL
jgi:hypothetical protein